MPWTVTRLRVFCHDGSGGNPLPLVLHAEGMQDGDMFRLARDNNSECCFVFAPTSVDENINFHFRFFVPRHEMEMCGHATIGALWLLRESGRIDNGACIIKTLSGLVTGYVGSDIQISQPLGHVGPVGQHIDEILSVLRIQAEDLRDVPIQNATTSRTKTLIPLKTPADVNALQPDFDRIAQLCEAINSTGLYPYAPVNGSDTTFEARQFPARAGFQEDAATGVAAAALARGCIENGTIKAPDAPITIFQGRAMGSLSAIHVAIETAADGSPSGLRISGRVMYDD